MQYIENKNEIKNHIVLVDALINRKETEKFVYQNIFNKKFKYFLFVEGGAFPALASDGLEKYLSEMNAVDFYISILTEKECIIPYSFDASNRVAYQNLIVELDESSYEFFLEETHNVYWEYIYYTKTLNWCGWLDKSADIGIFAFQTENLVKKFLEKFDRNLFYSPHEMVNENWSWRMPKKEYGEAFLKNYSDLSYLKNNYKEQQN